MSKKKMADGEVDITWVEEEESLRKYLFKVKYKILAPCNCYDEQMLMWGKIIKFWKHFI